MNACYQRLLECLTLWSEDASDVVSGEAVLYSDYKPTPDAIFDSLGKPCDLDSTVQEILQVVCTSLTILLS